MAVDRAAGTTHEPHAPGPCALCGRDPAAGLASIGDERYCHGDEDPEPTCYMRSQGAPWGGWQDVNYGGLDPDLEAAPDE